MQAGLDAGDPEGEVGAASLAKESLREVHGTRSVREARRRLRNFHRRCRDAGSPELARLSNTVRSWEHEILGWHRTGLSTGPTEAANLLIKKVKWTGYGFRNFGNHRLRPLLHCCNGRLHPAQQSEAVNHASSRGDWRLPAGGRLRLERDPLS